MLPNQTGAQQQLLQGIMRGPTYPSGRTPQTISENGQSNPIAAPALRSEHGAGQHAVVPYTQAIHQAIGTSNRVQKAIGTGAQMLAARTAIAHAIQAAKSGGNGMVEHNGMTDIGSILRGLHGFPGGPMGQINPGGPMQHASVDPITQAIQQLVNPTQSIGTALQPGNQEVDPAIHLAMLLHAIQQMHQVGDGSGGNVHTPGMVGAA